MGKFLFSLVILCSIVSASYELNPDDVVGFEVLVADKCDNSFQCAFGHSFLRVVTKNGNSSSDPVLAFTTDNFEANSLADKIGFATKGLFALPLNSDFTSIGSVTYQYMNVEKREIKRVPLQMTAQNKEALVKGINEIISLRKEKNEKGYDILFNNCAGKIVELLNKAGSPREFFGFAIPNNLPDYLYRTYNAQYPVITIPYNPNFSRKDLNEKFEALPPSYYKFCEESECAEQVVRTFNKYFPNGKIEFPNYEVPDPEFRQTVYRTRTTPTHWNGQKQNVDRHYDLILEVQSKSKQAAPTESGTAQ